MKLVNLYETNEWENVQPSEDVEQEMRWIQRKIKALQHKHEIDVTRLKPYTSLFLHRRDPAYEAQNPTAKYRGFYVHNAFFRDAFEVPFLIPNNTPNIQKLWPHISRLANQTVSNLTQYQKLQKVEKALNKKYRQLAMDAMKSSSSAYRATSTEMNEIARTKETLIIGGRKVKNPLAQDMSGAYVGSPELYPDLTNTQQDILIELQNALKKAGLPPLTVLYGSRYGGRNINFVVTNADQSFGWRKYDVGGASGQNIIYLKDKTKINTHSFLHKPLELLNKHQK